MGLRTFLYNIFHNRRGYYWDREYYGNVTPYNQYVSEEYIDTEPGIQKEVCAVAALSNASTDSVISKACCEAYHILCPEQK